jgi:hypothetical protein
MTDETVQKGNQYPNVVRILTPGSDEYNEYDTNWGSESGRRPTLTWEVPASRADGSTLVPIDYYTIDYGGVDTVANPGVLASSIVYAPTTEFYMPTPEPLKTYRARISATDDNGKTSQLSGFVYVTAAA